MKGQRIGGRRPFGYEQDGLTVRPAEAMIIAEAANRVIAGESIRSIRLDLNARGVTTSTGREWTNSQISETLRNPRYAGKRTYLGEVVAEAEWPALLSTDVWSRLQSVLTAPERRWRGGPLKRWMTRVASCGRCGAPLVAGQVSRRRGPTYTFTTDRGCGRLAIKAEWLEQSGDGLVL